MIMRTLFLALSVCVRGRWIHGPACMCEGQWLMSLEPGKDKLARLNSQSSPRTSQSLSIMAGFAGPFCHTLAFYFSAG